MMGCKTVATDTVAQDAKAEKMLLYQRNNGGWPQYKGDATDYEKPVDEALKNKLLSDKDQGDATIDDRSTTLEINYLLEIYPKTQNQTYLKAAEKGIQYLLEAQNAAGGWPQHYPDTSRYRKHITYNDNAMINVLWIIKGLADDEGIYQVVNPQLKREAKTALQKGIQCMLNTQVKQNGRLTVWCAQHDNQTLLPAQARAFEPPSLSGAESVGITRFLMSIDQPSPEIIQAVQSAVQWFEEVKIEGYNTEIRSDSSQPSGKDRVIFEDPESTIWARFYELQTNRPIFIGRNSEIKYDLKEVENERRVGYAFYGKWPKRLLQKEYPLWREKWVY